MVKAQLRAAAMTAKAATLSSPVHRSSAADNEPDSTYVAQEHERGLRHRGVLRQQAFAASWLRLGPNAWSVDRRQLAEAGDDDPLEKRVGKSPVALSLGPPRP
jgi:hypothetical protein